MPNLEDTTMMLTLWAVLGYLLGSVPFGLLLAKVMNLGNLREIGSGNIGATNVLRTGNKTAAALTLLLDGAKGALAVLVARAAAGEEAAQVAGLAAMVGHCYPVWLKFAGGKGVATFLGILLALNIMVGLGACLAWLTGAFATRISSMGALVAAVAAIPLSLAFAFITPIAIWVVVVMGAIIFWRHRGNIDRIREGTEPKIREKKT